VTENVKAAPFLRWAGGKSKIVGSLKACLPPPASYNRYIEPFLGGGSLFFAVSPKEAILGDLNEDLINCYVQVSMHPYAVWSRLQAHLRSHSRQYYLQLRSRLRNGDALERAARFIYINKSAFNGIYRVNRRGEFNVPYGPTLGGPALPTKVALANASKALRHATLLVASFEETCNLARPGDLVYLDPPYLPAGKSAFFTHYTADRFGERDHKHVAGVFRELDKRGCLLMMSNCDQRIIRALYQGYRVRKLDVTRWLGSDGNRFKARELVITNFRPPI
jgi:DNA adenine methylase